MNERDPGNDHRITKKVGGELERKVVGLPQNMSDGFIQRIRPKCFAGSLVVKLIMWVLQTNEADKSA